MAAVQSVEYGRAARSVLQMVIMGQQNLSEQAVDVVAVAVVAAVRPGPPTPLSAPHRAFLRWAGVIANT